MVEAELLPVLKHNYVCLFNGTVKTCYRYRYIWTEKCTCFNQKYKLHISAFLNNPNHFQPTTYKNVNIQLPPGHNNLLWIYFILFFFVVFKHRLHNVEHHTPVGMHLHHFLMFAVQFKHTNNVFFLKEKDEKWTTDIEYIIDKLPYSALSWSTITVFLGFRCSLGMALRNKVK